MSVAVWSLFIFCIGLQADVICHGRHKCVDSFVDCSLNGDPIQFCAAEVGKNYLYDCRKFLDKK